MLLWLSLPLFLDLHISSTFDWVTEALDVSSFFCGRCSVKSNDSASQERRTVYMLRMRKAVGQQECTQKLFIWWKYLSSATWNLDWKKNLLILTLLLTRIATQLSLFLFSIPHLKSLQKKWLISQNSGKIFWRLRARQITAVHWLFFLMKDEGFAVPLVLIWSLRSCLAQ